METEVECIYIWRSRSVKSYLRSSIEPFFVSSERKYLATFRTGYEM
jgi:hypothetical protein